MNVAINVRNVPSSGILWVSSTEKAWRSRAREGVDAGLAISSYTPIQY